VQGFDSEHYQALGNWDEKMRIDIVNTRMRLYWFVGLGVLFAILSLFLKAGIIPFFVVIFFTGFAVLVLWLKIKYLEFVLRQKKREDRRW
jgi:membrane protein implicated in regulation of membrane protease activity